ncbi:hypothetical protein [Gordonia sp. QH-12]|uniref:DUF7448 domain-containing protein n=1 Tax=unclassified Gordonia (in: high G+C Gram-positive bacteria) TaxID=2657482 RepID=UPI0009EE2BD4|nr:hypothetical protein [Gordonia sp. QH-12]
MTVPAHNPYPPDSADNYPDWPADDNGTMPDSVNNLAAAVIGRRIVSVEPHVSFNSNDFEAAGDSEWWHDSVAALMLTLDDGRRVAMVEQGDCCAFTDIKKFLLHPDKVNHAITGVATENGYTKWHILADLGDVLELDVDWSCGNPFYYSYGFTIGISNTIDGRVITNELPAGGDT